MLCASISGFAMETASENGIGIADPSPENLLRQEPNGRLSRRTLVAGSFAAAPLLYEAPRLMSLGEPRADTFGASGPREATSTPTVEIEDEATATPTPRSPGNTVEETPTPDVPDEDIDEEIVRVLPSTGVGRGR